MAALKPGVKAPNFSLSTTPDQKVSLYEFRGQPVVLVFYPADWSPVCSDQLGLYNELKPEFSEFGAQIIGISVDGVYREKDGESERALFVIDAKGVIRWSHVSPVGINPGAGGILKALESMAKNGK
ncbi:MAG: redoxin domain-containing protein [Desulfomonilaceae bacterium]